MRPITYRYERKWKGDMGTGGRFYAPFCNLPKTQRLAITIDGEPVGSWDFSQLHPTLLLLLHTGINTETNLFSTGDVYNMPGYPELPRAAHKKFINTILNARSREAAVKSISTAHHYWDLIDDCWAYETYSGKQTRSGVPVWPDKPQATADEYVDSFLFNHPNFTELAFKGMWGTLQLIDSSVIEEAVRQGTAMGVPVLPVHDELVVPVSKKQVVKSLLIRSFNTVTESKFESHEPAMSWTAPNPQE